MDFLWIDFRAAEFRIKNCLGNGFTVVSGWSDGTFGIYEDSGGQFDLHQLSTGACIGFFAQRDAAFRAACLARRVGDWNAEALPLTGGELELLWFRGGLTPTFDATGENVDWVEGRDWIDAA